METLINHSFNWTSLSPVMRGNLMAWPVLRLQVEESLGMWGVVVKVLSKLAVFDTIHF
jgi:hypothetical protein